MCTQIRTLAKSDLCLSGPPPRLGLPSEKYVNFKDFWMYVNWTKGSTALLSILTKIIGLGIKVHNRFLNLVFTCDIIFTCKVISSFMKKHLFVFFFFSGFLSINLQRKRGPEINSVSSTQ